MIPFSFNSLWFFYFFVRRSQDLMLSCCFSRSFHHLLNFKELENPFRFDIFNIIFSKFSRSTFFFDNLYRFKVAIPAAPSKQEIIIIMVDQFYDARYFPSLVSKVSIIWYFIRRTNGVGWHRRIPCPYSAKCGRTSNIFN